MAAASNLTAVPIDSATTQSSPHHGPGLPFLQEFLLTIKVLCSLWPAITLFGLISNMTNIIVFSKTSPKNNVTILLLSLAVSDLIFLILASPKVSIFFILAVFPSYEWPFNFRYMNYLLYWPTYTAYDISSYISVSLAVIRCACVAMPLKFKFFFTNSRTVKWVFCLVFITLALRMPVLTINRLAWRMDPETNVSSLYVKSTNNEMMSRINDIMNRGVMIYTAYTVTILCTALLIVKLNKASKIRRSSTPKSPQSPDVTSHNQAPGHGLSVKDVQVVKSVVLVCILFILFQLPFVVSSTLRLLLPDFDADKRLMYAFGIFSQINTTCSFLNASLNIFVYYNYNSKFRAVFCSVFMFLIRKSHPASDDGKHL
ncbi:chemosensory receptor A [Elysia marginata]|uniref:Chemosensory receptor A n=1 Tax=Elysia marginata TaxID=1093978 RepID=A0AAV4EH03_9GAST|nr:chemosensory receptor A [Elysia marginata]